MMIIAITRNKDIIEITFIILLHIVFNNDRVKVLYILVSILSFIYAD